MKIQKPIAIKCREFIDFGENYPKKEINKKVRKFFKKLINKYYQEATNEQ